MVAGSINLPVAGEAGALSTPTPFLTDPKQRTRPATLPAAPAPADAPAVDFLPVRVLQRELIIGNGTTRLEKRSCTPMSPMKVAFPRGKMRKRFSPLGKVKYKSEKKVPFSFPPFQTLLSSQENAKTP